MHEDGRRARRRLGDLVPGAGLDVRLAGRPREPVAGGLLGLDVARVPVDDGVERLQVARLDAVRRPVRRDVLVADAEPPAVAVLRDGAAEHEPGGLVPGHVAVAVEQDPCDRRLLDDGLVPRRGVERPGDDLRAQVVDGGRRRGGLTVDDETDTAGPAGAPARTTAEQAVAREEPGRAEERAVVRVVQQRRGQDAASRAVRTEAAESTRAEDEPQALALAARGAEHLRPVGRAARIVHCLDAVGAAEQPRTGEGGEVGAFGNRVVVVHVVRDGPDAARQGRGVDVRGLEGAARDHDGVVEIEVEPQDALDPVERVRADHRQRVAVGRTGRDPLDRHAFVAELGPVAEAGGVEDRLGRRARDVRRRDDRVRGRWREQAGCDGRGRDRPGAYAPDVGLVHQGTSLTGGTEAAPTYVRTRPG
ncbi:unannotated protein [freshwater metagenome]|uniref:Unannotated protein n=1 Tax=freshwater metagenome TaxID=449393 RepID=A0A6J7KFP5_9ZZZZ